MLDVVALVEERALLLVIEFRALLVVAEILFDVDVDVLAGTELELAKGNTVCTVFKLCKGT